MNRASAHVVLLLLVPLCLGSAEPDRSGDVPIPGGRYEPLYGVKGESTAVADFRIDRIPVTTDAYLEFVRDQPQWRRSLVKPLFAERGYLASWRDDLDPGAAAGPGRQGPVVEVSWFAASAYCRWAKGRLPTLSEWEFVARASESDIDALDDPRFRQRILDWYARPTPVAYPAVGSGFVNVYGVYDMHGLVWEWVSDWNSVLLTGESRVDAAAERQLYCAAGAAGAADPGDYAAFLRFAMRASLSATYAVGNLGFRCARDGEGA